MVKLAYSLVLTPTPCRVAGCIRSMYSCVNLLTYLLTQYPETYKAGNITETAEDKVKVTINDLYNVVH